MQMSATDERQKTRERLHFLYSEMHELYENCARDAELREAKMALMSDNFERAEHFLNKFKTKEELINELEDVLVGKSVYQTLKRVRNGEVQNSVVMAKGLSSLLTHIIIELEKDKKEYTLIAKEVYNLLGKVLL